ncbi:hypothetical protein DICPUDRAFT_52340 [Dictyostelium purpureum]|uniref:Pyrrolidone-carboxylate peptidase n=1 Tax=Dictyostelium purpureum TaxID=5786 RepID=F0Z7W7_DICPU|nr:uncharacterized protein DICPUDRAFT_52340 [Dictyostelium purpureum]EGC39979.1 hypothetical protein DICPUDRAFT_52340 [Dictyostelium purpureum]|eukprot:XP_003283482.1 hypothetical protein DICPUDRAFT_52340 [Dictyostelium purpureum]
MGSNLIKKKIILSGFGKFCGVEDNPSSHLVRDIENYINTLENKNELKFEIVKKDIIEVSAEATNHYLKTLENVNLNKDNNQNPFLLHLGVSSSELSNRLEMYGWNMADFRCKDERGWMPSKELIDQDDSNEKYETQLPILEFTNQLSSLNYKVKESDDPGRFLCNYIYFLSLKLSKQYKTDSLFLHIPEFKTIDKNSQLKFLVDLMNLIAVEKLK